MIDNAPKRIMIVPARAFIAFTVPSSRPPHWRIALAQESFAGPRLSRTTGRRFAGIRACLTALIVRRTCSYRVPRMLAAISWISACWPSAGWPRFLRLMPPVAAVAPATYVANRERYRFLARFWPCGQISCPRKGAHHTIALRIIAGARANRGIVGRPSVIMETYATGRLAA